MSYQQYRPQPLNSLPVVIKNLLIINGLFFLATFLFQKSVPLDNYLALHYYESELFRPYQLVTYMFMHGDLFHIFFNMLALFMFGSTLENFWGPKRFLIFYFVTGIGAALIYLGWQTFEYHQLEKAVGELMTTVDPDSYLAFVREHFSGLYNHPDNKPIFDNFVSEWAKHPQDPGYLMRAAQDLNEIVRLTKNNPMVGASGAIYGILVAFGMLFPNVELIILPIPFPIKARIAVIIFAVMEFTFGVANIEGDNIAHFAHLGGALFGFILLKYWQRNSNRFY